MVDLDSLEEKIINIITDKIEHIVKNIIIDNIPMIIKEIEDYNYRHRPEKLNLLCNLDFEFIDTADISILDDMSDEDKKQTEIIADEIIGNIEILDCPNTYNDVDANNINADIVYVHDKIITDDRITGDEVVDRNNIDDVVIPDKITETSDKIIKKKVDKNANSKNKNKNKNTITNSNCPDITYAKKNYIDAHNYVDLMSPSLTKDEITLVKENGSVNGCYEILKRRCIDNTTKKTRPFHCINQKKYKNGIETIDFILKNYDWGIDLGGKQILNEIYPKIRDIYDVGCAKNITAKMRNLKSITNLEKNGIKILKKINKDLVRMDKIENNKSRLKISTED